MRNAVDVQLWLDKVQIKADNISSVKNWLWATDEYNGTSFDFNIEEYGKTLIDVIEFVNSPSPSKDKDLSPIVAQFAKVKKEVDKLQKLIAKI